MLTTTGEERRLIHTDRACCAIIDIDWLGAVWHVASDVDSGTEDGRALKGAGVIPYTSWPRVVSEVTDDLRRMRFEGTLPRLWHFSTPITDKGMILFGTALAARFWRDARLETDGIQLLVLSNCAGLQYADRFRGVADYVVAIARPLTGEDVPLFLTVLWHNLHRYAVDASFEEALQTVPRLAPVVRLYTG